MTPDLLLDLSLALAVAGYVVALVPALLFVSNLIWYRPPPAATPAATVALEEPQREPAVAGASDSAPEVSILVPARDEEGNIGRAVTAALASRGVEVEVVVLDDGSRDRTAEIVRALAAADPRVRLEAAPPLPAGWCGKQHACARLAELARAPLLLFVDADVRLAPDGVARSVAALEASGADLVSGLPRQETGTFLERLLIPLIHFVLLGYLPMGWMRRTRRPAFGAGCGQLFLARAAAYRAMGGHGAVRASLHDGVSLPRAFRRAGLDTDLFDATEVAVCRMYRGAAEVWRGFAKNATEGMAAPAAIVPWTLLLVTGQVLPPVLLVAFALGLPAAPGALGVALLGTGAAYAPRLLAAGRFHQSWTGALLHPAGVLVLLAIQWTALARHLAGRPAAWKGRGYSGRASGRASGRTA